MTPEIVLHDTRSDNYRISGVAIHIAVDRHHDQVPEAVPRDKTMGVMGYPEKDRERLILAIGINQDNDTSSNDLVGYHVHDSCWKLLTHHVAGKIARRDLALVVKNLIVLPEEKPLLAVEGWKDVFSGEIVLDGMNSLSLQFDWP